MGWLGKKFFHYAGIALVAGLGTVGSNKAEPAKAEARDPGTEVTHYSGMMVLDCTPPKGPPSMAGGDDINLVKTKDGTVSVENVISSEEPGTRVTRTFPTGTTCKPLL